MLGKILPYGVCLLVIAGLVYRRYELQTQNEALKARIQQLESALQKEKSAEKHLTEEITQEKQELQRQTDTRAAELQSLVQRIRNEDQTLSGIAARLKTFGAHGKVDSSAVQIQIQRDQDRLSKLNARLRDYKNAEKEASQEGDQNLKLRKSQAALDTAEINSQIKKQQELIKETNKDIGTWKKRKHDINQGNELTRLNKVLEEQTAGLQQLQADKQRVQMNDAQHAQEIKIAVSQEKEDLQDTEAQIKEQIKNTELDLKQLRESLNKSNSANSASDKQLKDLQQQYAQQAQKIRELTQEYESKKAALEKK